LDSNYYNRLLVGSIILLVVAISFFLKLDIYLISIVVMLITYDIYNIKIIKLPVLIFFCLSTLLTNFLLSDQIKNVLSIFLILVVIFIIFSNNYKKELFSLSVFIFCIILFNIVSTDRNLFYIILLISFFNDTVAYIFGKSIGGPLIVPFISPKKTWSGTLISFTLSSLLLFFIGFDILFSSLIAIFLFLGDIFFSYIKRYLNLNDFSTLLKGHGGILDRIDSMFFITIIFQIYLIL